MNGLLLRGSFFGYDEIAENFELCSFHIDDIAGGIFYGVISDFEGTIFAGDISFCYFGLIDHIAGLIDAVGLLSFQFFQFCFNPAFLKNGLIL